MPRIRGLNGSISNRNIDTGEFIWNEVTVLQLEEYYNNRRLGYDRHGFYYLEDQHFRALENGHILINTEYEAARIELDNIRLRGGDTVITNDFISNAMSQINWGIPNSSTNYIPGGYYSQIVEKKKSRYKTFEVGDRVHCDNTFNITSDGYILSIDKQYNTYSIQEDTGNIRIWVKDHLTIRRKALKVGDKVKLIDSIAIRHGRDNRCDTEIGIVKGITIPSQANINRFVSDIPILPGLQDIHIDFPSYPNFHAYNDEVRLIEEDIEDTQEEEMKDDKRIPLNKPNIDLKYKNLGDLMKYKYNVNDTEYIYGYKFNEDKVLVFEEMSIKNDKVRSIFKIVDKDTLSEDFTSSFFIEYKDFFENKVKDKKSKSKEEYDKNLRDYKKLEKIISNTCFIKVNKYLDSSKLFGYKNIKKDMIGNYYPIESISYNYLNDDRYVSIVSIFNTKLNKTIKFLLSDLEIIKPDPTMFLKSYNEPKDKTIKIGSNVKVINDRYSKVSKGEHLVVSKIDFDRQFVSNEAVNRIRRDRFEGGITSEAIVSIGSQVLDSITDRTIEVTDLNFGEIQRSMNSDENRYFRIARESSRTSRRSRSRRTLSEIINSTVYSTHKSKKQRTNPDCKVWCLNKQGEQVKLKMKQIRIV